MSGQDPNGNIYNETVTELAEGCSTSFFEAYPPIQENSFETNRYCSASIHNRLELSTLIQRVLSNPNDSLSGHSEKHSYEFAEVFHNLNNRLKTGDLVLETDDNSISFQDNPNSFARIPRYRLTTREIQTREVEKFFPVQYAIELSHIDLESKSKAKHIRKLLETDPAFGMITGLCTIASSRFTDTPELQKEDLFRAFGDKLDFFTTNNKEHRGIIINLLLDLDNIHNTSLYEETLNKLYRLFPKLTRSHYAIKKGTFIDKFKPLMVLGSSEEYLQGYLDRHDIKITPSIVGYLENKGVFDRITNSIITCYLDHSYKQDQHLSLCHTSDSEWGITKYLNQYSKNQ